MATLGVCCSMPVRQRIWSVAHIGCSQRTRRFSSNHVMVEARAHVLKSNGARGGGGFLHGCPKAQVQIALALLGPFGLVWIGGFEP